MQRAGFTAEQLGDSTLEPVEVFAVREITALARDGARTWALIEGRTLWAKSEDGPWQVIAGNLDASGQYTWKVPTGIPPKILVRAEAAGTELRRSQTATAN